MPHIRKPVALSLASVIIALALESCAAPPSGNPSVVASELPSSTPGTPAPTSHPTDAVASGALSAADVSRTPWGFADVAGQLITTPHYRIYTTVDNAYLLDQLPGYVERALSHYTSAVAPLPMPEEPFETFLLGTRKQWEAKTRQILPDQAKTYLNIGRGGFSTRGIAVLYDIDVFGASDTLAIAAHEGWHQYTQQVFKHPLPVWLEEGIATYMEGHSGFRGQTPRFLPWKNRERFDTLRNASRSGKLISLTELLRRSPQSFLESSSDELLRYYAQVWALTHFLVEGEGGRYHDGLADLLQDGANGRIAGRLQSSGLAPAQRRRGMAVLTKLGTLVAETYFNPNIAELEAEYARFIEAVTTRKDASTLIAAGRSPLTSP